MNAYAGMHICTDHALSVSMQCTFQKCSCGRRLAMAPCIICDIYIYIYMYIYSRRQPTFAHCAFARVCGRHNYLPLCALRRPCQLIIVCDFAHYAPTHLEYLYLFLAFRTVVGGVQKKRCNNISGIRYLSSHNCVATNFAK